MVVWRLTCEMWVIHHSVLSFSWELMAFGKGSVTSLCHPHKSWDAAAATLQAPALSPWEMQPSSLSVSQTFVCGLKGRAHPWSICLEVLGLGLKVNSALSLFHSNSIWEGSREAEGT